MNFGIRNKMENCLNGLDLDSDIYRIFSYTRFKKLVQSQKLALVNTDKWDDPYENFLLNRAILDGNDHIDVSRLFDSWYGQCWTTNRDTDALWRIYSHNKDGVRVKIKARDLFDVIWDDADPFKHTKYFIGIVEYQPTSNIEDIVNSYTFQDLIQGGQNTSFARSLLIKREAFEHENEVRLLFSDVQNNRGKNKVAEFNMATNSVISEICLDPRLSNQEFLKIKADIAIMGCTCPVIRSDLYELNLNPLKLA